MADVIDSVWRDNGWMYVCLLCGRGKRVSYSSASHARYHFRHVHQLFITSLPERPSRGIGPAVRAEPISERRRSTSRDAPRSRISDSSRHQHKECDRAPESDSVRGLEFPGDQSTSADVGGRDPTIAVGKDDVFKVLGEIGVAFSEKQKEAYMKLVEKSIQGVCSTGVEDVPAVRVAEAGKEIIHCTTERERDVQSGTSNRGKRKMLRPVLTHLDDPKKKRVEEKDKGGVSGSNKSVVIAGEPASHELVVSSGGGGESQEMIGLTNVKKHKKSVSAVGAKGDAKLDSGKGGKKHGGAILREAGDSTSARGGINRNPHLGSVTVEEDSQCVSDLLVAAEVNALPSVSSTNWLPEYLPGREFLIDQSERWGSGVTGENLTPGDISNIAVTSGGARSFESGGLFSPPSTSSAVMSRSSSRSNPLWHPMLSVAESLGLPMSVPAMVAAARRLCPRAEVDDLYETACEVVLSWIHCARTLGRVRRERVSGGVGGASFPDLLNEILRLPRS